MIEVREVTKTFGPVTALDRLSFVVRPGLVTGFLGPNGAGKTTTMRVILGLDHPTAGKALVGGQRYQEITWPLHEVGSLLDANALHPGRRARNVRVVDGEKDAVRLRAPAQLLDGEHVLGLELLERLSSEQEGGRGF